MLLRHAGVAEAAVVPLKDPGGDGCDRRLVVAGSSAPDAATLIPICRQHSRRPLPAFVAVVHRRVRLAAALISGAVDRNALQSAQAPLAPEQDASAAVRRDRGAPGTTLGRDVGRQVGCGDYNFFELGGHSLLAARMLAQVEREFGRRIKLATRCFWRPPLYDFAKKYWRKRIWRIRFSAKWLKFSRTARSAP